MHRIVGITVDQFKHYLGELRVELRPHALDYLISHHVLGQRVTIASFRCHCVIGISDRNYPGNFRYLLPFQTVGITLTVVALMSADAEGGIFAYFLEYLVSDDRVGLYHAELLVRKLAVLVDYILRNAYLSNVMEHTCKVNILTLLLAFTHGFCNHYGVLRNS